MNYSTIAFVNQDYQINELIDILEKKIGNRNVSTDIYKKYWIGGADYQAPPQNFSWIREVKVIKEYVPDWIVLFDHLGGFLIFEHSGELFESRIQWMNFVEQMYSVYQNEYAVLITFETN